MRKPTNYGNNSCGNMTLSKVDVKSVHFDSDVVDSMDGQQLLAVSSSSYFAMVGCKGNSSIGIMNYKKEGLGQEIIGPKQNLVSISRLNVEHKEEAEENEFFFISIYNNSCTT